MNHAFIDRRMNPGDTMRSWPGELSLSQKIIDKSTAAAVFQNEDLLTKVLVFQWLRTGTGDMAPIVSRVALKSGAIFPTDASQGVLQNNDHDFNPRHWEMKPQK